MNDLPHSDDLIIDRCVKCGMPLRTPWRGDDICEECQQLGPFLFADEWEMGGER